MSRYPPGLGLQPTFMFALNLRSADVDLPYEIAPGYTLMRATDNQIAHIKDHLKPFWGTLPRGRNPWEKDYPHVPLSRESWRYFVVDCPPPLSPTHRVVQHAFNLSSLELEFGFAFYESPGDSRAISVDPSTFFQVLESIVFHADTTFIHASKTDLEEVRGLFGPIRVHTGYVPTELGHNLNTFQQIKGLPPHSRLRIAGYFSIIESLVTHKPGTTSSGPGSGLWQCIRKVAADSLTKQVTAKMPALSARFRVPLDHQAAFPATPTPEKAWKLLYEYRSRIVHGSLSSIAAKDLKALGTWGTVEAFLRHSARQLMRYALEHPGEMAIVKASSTA